MTALLVAGGFLVLGFQNCSQPVPVDSEEALKLAAAKVDFGYEATIDQISYMSCAVSRPGTFDAGAYYSFRVGAYRTGGLRINDTFRAANGKKPPEKQAELLSESPANTSTNIQFSIRQLANFQMMYTGTGTAVRGQDYVNVLEPLGTLDLSDLLVRMDADSRVRYLRNGTVFGSRMEGSLYFTQNPTLAGSIRTFLRNDAMLAQTYSHMAEGTTTDTLARSPRDTVPNSTANPYSQVFGRGYKIKFAQPSIGATASSANFPDVVLREISEQKLTPLDTSSLSTWTCPDTMRFRIVRPEDVRANRVVCTMAPDPTIPTQDLSIIRNQLRVEDWYIDMTNRCIVPKKAPATCYGSQVTSVQYDITQTCQEGTGDACVSFASVCYRL